MKYEVTVAGAATGLIPRAERTPPSREPAQSQRRTTIHPTQQQGEYDSHQPGSQWMVNVIGIEIGVALGILATLVRRNLRR